MVRKMRGNKTSLPPPPEAAGFTDEMAVHLQTAGYQFVFNKKTAGYAVGYAEDVPQDKLANVRTIMERQAANSGGKFIFEATSGFFDITLASLSKARALEDIKPFYTKSSIWVACGDSANTDGPMLDVADRGIMVLNHFGNYPVVEDHHAMLKILVWFYKFKNHGRTILRAGERA